MSLSVSVQTFQARLSYFSPRDVTYFLFYYFYLFLSFLFIHFYFFLISFSVSSYIFVPFSKTERSSIFLGKLIADEKQDLFFLLHIPNKFLVSFLLPSLVLFPFPPPNMSLRVSFLVLLLYSCSFPPSITVRDRAGPP